MECETLYHVPCRYLAEAEGLIGAGNVDIYIPAPGPPASGRSKKERRQKIGRKEELRRHRWRMTIDRNVLKK
jgi:hypothetical protein